MEHKLADAKKMVEAIGEFGSLLASRKQADGPAGRRSSSTPEPESAADEELIPLGSREPTSQKLVLSSRKILSTAGLFSELHAERMPLYVLLSTALRLYQQ